MELVQYWIQLKQIQWIDMKNNWPIARNTECGLSMQCVQKTTHIGR